MRHTKRLDNSIVSSPLRDIYFPICPHYSYYIFYNADNILSIVFPDIIVKFIVPYNNKNMRRDDPDPTDSDCRRPTAAASRDSNKKHLFSVHGKQVPNVLRIRKAADHFVRGAIFWFGSKSSPPRLIMISLYPPLWRRLAERRGLTFFMIKHCL